MPNLISIDDVRNKNKDLLLTDKIEDLEIETCIIDATDTVMTRLNEVFEEPIDDALVTPAIKLCIKLIACANCIRDNYSDNERALMVAKDYHSEATANIKSIVAGNKLQKVGVKPYRKSVSYSSSYDNFSAHFITKVSCKYR
jgi:hypothetical protein